MCRPRSSDPLDGDDGTGKTAVAIELGDRLELAGEPYALVDLDWLGWVSPRPPRRDVAVGAGPELRLIWLMFREAGVGRLAPARFVEDGAQLEDFWRRRRASSCSSCAWSPPRT